MSPNPPLLTGTLPGDISIVAHTHDPTETKDDLEQLTAEIKKMANSVRNKLKSEWLCPCRHVTGIPVPVGCWDHRGWQWGRFLRGWGLALSRYGEEHRAGRGTILRRPPDTQVPGELRSTSGVPRSHSIPHGDKVSPSVPSLSAAAPCDPRPGVPLPCPQHPVLSPCATPCVPWLSRHCPLSQCFVLSILASGTHRALSVTRLTSLPHPQHLFLSPR